MATAGIAASLAVLTVIIIVFTGSVATTISLPALYFQLWMMAVWRLPV